MVEHPDDATLLRRYASAREEEAFAALVRRHRPRVRSACRRFLTSEHDVEDAVQSTFVTLARRAPEIEWEGSVAGWLCAVARRVSWNTRSHRPSRERPFSDLASGDGALPDELHPRTDATSEVTRRELRTVLGAEIGRLPEKYRAPVLLCDLQGMTHEEAAEKLGWPTGSMSRRLGRARALLRDRLTARGFGLVIVTVSLFLATRPSDESGPAGGPGSRGFAVAGRNHAGLGRELRPRLAALAGGGPIKERNEAAEVARLALAMAGELSGQAGGSDDTSAGRALGEFRDAAGVLASLTRPEADPAAVPAAARALGDRCLRCHMLVRR